MSPMILPGMLVLSTTDPATTFVHWFFLVISYVWGSPFYLFAIPYIYWGRDRRLGIEVAIMFLTSSLINVWLKDWFKVPRPPKKEWVPSWAEPGSYSFPSGHAQAAGSFWTFMSVMVRKYWMVVTGVVLTGLVCYSRVYIGVHTWTEIIVGLLIGLAIAIIFIGIRKKAYHLVTRMDHVQRLSLAVAIPVMLFLCVRTVTFGQLSGFLMGVLVGAEIDSMGLHMPECKNGPQRRARLVTGYLLCGAIMFGLGHFGNSEPGWQFAVYTLSGMGVTYFAPLLFSKLEKWDGQ